MDQERLYLIDGSGFIHRAYHALPPLTRPDGTPVNAVMGFANMMLKLLTDFESRRITVIMDAKKKNWRHEIYPAYKAQRDSPVSELTCQYPLIYDAVRAFGMPLVEAEGWEADDVIATYAKIGTAIGFDVTIVSSDKDLMQLIRPGVNMFDPLKSKWVNGPEVYEKFNVGPERVTDVQALVGDKVDNVPGVPGIGVVKASALIKEFGSFENLIENIDMVAQINTRNLLKVHEENARLSYRLVGLDYNVPVEMPLKTDVEDLDYDRLRGFCDANGFEELKRRIDALEKGIVVDPDLYSI